MLLQSLSLRRLSYVIFAAEKNHFLAQLPSVIEKLVEIFKNVTSPVVHSEVYLCLRVLLCRLSPHNLTSFWPVVLTELVSIVYVCNILFLTQSRNSTAHSSSCYRPCLQMARRHFRSYYLPASSSTCCLFFKRKSSKCEVPHA
jgi:hypothetical protein